MPKRKTERPQVEKLLKERRYKSHEIAKEVGLIDTMGYDKAVDYVRRVRRAMKKNGELTMPPDRFAPAEARLEDLTKLFEIRQGTMSKEAARYMLLLNCYYRLCSQDDQIHMRAIDDTYEKNCQLVEPLTMAEAISICETAVAQYMNFRDEEANAAAKAMGYPGSGLNYTTDSHIEKLQITEEEQQYMNTMRRHT